MKTLLENFKSSLSLTLLHFYLDFSVPDLLHSQSPSDDDDVPAGVLQSLFMDDREVIDLESKSLLTITVVELVDGIFLGCREEKERVFGRIKIKRLASLTAPPSPLKEKTASEAGEEQSNPLNVAKKAVRALKGIVRLPAIIRGRAVR
ncbi:hypothetical protein FEM48_Zijuj10G0002300 [Ziziphus jujuba var. spinosa]|uniref:Uncharacterized protein n=1 Tax=Ziziphus jujuba var. spinosa TaxID=714518 RepID=A0A978UK52_ZIZJJ|nr:hypothetical protein FEM48_Zijuj10G0002300 [Ziziphus jujuba var. spinosa]